jgi:hypothetical protein
MHRFCSALLLLTLVLSACSPGLPSTEAASGPPTDLPPTEQIETSTSINPNCAYQWAYQDLPELSTELQQAIQALQPGAQANAFVFGEDCVYADGSRKFLAMETDFNLTLQVTDLTDEDAFGEWIVKAMQIILNIPKEKIIGPRPGRVSIIFQSDDQNHGINFYIDQYQLLPTRLSNAEIYQALKTP